MPTDPRLLSAERLAGLKMWAGRTINHHDGATVDETKDHPKTDGTNCTICDQRALHRHIDALTDQLAEAAKREQALRAFAERVNTETWIVLDGLPGMPNTSWAAIPNATRAAWIQQAEAALEAGRGSASSESKG